MIRIFRRRKPETAPPVLPEVRLDAAKALVLPPDIGFQSRVAMSEKMEGMLSPFSMAAMDMMLCFQAARCVTGDMLEIGVYRGKSALLLGAHLSQSETLSLIDIHDYLDHAAMSELGKSFEIIITPSENLRAAMPRYTKRRGSFRFIHIDASHGFDQTFVELGIADELLAPGGIIAMDDFTNLNFSQNAAAIFRYLFSTKTQLFMLLATDAKAYLCRREDFDFYADFVFNRSVAEMSARGVSATLARTCFEPDYKAFYLREREINENHFYGENIYFNQIAAR